MDNITQEEFNEAILEVTGGPAWDIVKSGLLNDIYQVQAGALDAKSWEKVCEDRGFAKGLMHVIALRETLIKAAEIEKDNADL